MANTRNDDMGRSGNKGTPQGSTQGNQGNQRQTGNPGNAGMHTIRIAALPKAPRR